MTDETRFKELYGKVKSALQINDPSKLIASLHAFGEVLPNKQGPYQISDIAATEDRQPETPLTEEEIYELYCFTIAWVDPGLKKRGLIANAHLPQTAKDYITRGLKGIICLYSLDEQVKFLTVLESSANVSGINRTTNIKDVIAEKKEQAMTQAIRDYVPANSKIGHLAIRIFSVLVAIATGATIGASFIALVGLAVTLTNPLGWGGIVVFATLIGTGYTAYKSYKGLYEKLSQSIYRGHSLFAFRDIDTGEVKRVNFTTSIQVMLALIPSLVSASLFGIISYSGITAGMAALGLSGVILAPWVAIPLALIITIAHTIIIHNNFTNTFKHRNWLARISKRWDDLTRDKTFAQKVALVAILTMFAIASAALIAFIAMQGYTSLVDALTDHTFALAKNIAGWIAGIITATSLSMLLPTITMFATRAGKWLVEWHIREYFYNSMVQVTRFSPKVNSAINFLLSATTNLIGIGLYLAVTAVFLSINIVLHLPIVNVIADLLLHTLPKLWTIFKKEEGDIPFVREELSKKGLDPAKFSITQNKDLTLTVSVNKNHGLTLSELMTNAFIRKSKAIKGWLGKKNFLPIFLSELMATTHQVLEATTQGDGRIDTCGEATMGVCQFLAETPTKYQGISGNVITLDVIGIGALTVASCLATAGTSNGDPSEGQKVKLQLTKATTSAEIASTLVLSSTQEGIFSRLLSVDATTISAATEETPVPVVRGYVKLSENVTLPTPTPIPAKPASSVQRPTQQKPREDRRASSAATHRVSSTVASPWGTGNSHPSVQRGGERDVASSPYHSQQAPWATTHNASGHTAHHMTQVNSPWHYTPSSDAQGVGAQFGPAVNTHQQGNTYGPTIPPYHPHAAWSHVQPELRSGHNYQGSAVNTPVAAPPYVHNSHQQGYHSVPAAAGPVAQQYYPHQLQPGSSVIPTHDQSGVNQVRWNSHNPHHTEYSHGRLLGTLFAPRPPQPNFVESKHQQPPYPFPFPGNSTRG